MLAAAALLCFAGCMSRFPIGKRGNVTLRFYTEPIPESMVPVNDESLIGSTMNLTVSDSATVRRYVNSIRKWTDDTAVDRKEYVFIADRVDVGSVTDSRHGVLHKFADIGSDRV